MPFPVTEALGALGGYEAAEHGLLDTSTAAGWATIIAGGSFVLLVLMLGLRPAIGLIAALFLGIPVVNYLVRAHATAGADSSPFWAGFAIDY